MSEYQYKAVVVGASAGGVVAISSLLECLPSNFLTPICIVLHLPPDKNSMLDQIFNDKCSLQVKEADDKESIQPGFVYLAPPNYHLMVEQDFSLSLSSEDPVLYSRPSIDVLFETAADAYHEKLLGILLTGANSDGAKGLQTIIKKGGDGLVQSPDEAEAKTMPMAAIKKSPSARVESLENICLFLKSLNHD